MSTEPRIEIVPPWQQRECSECNELVQATRTLAREIDLSKFLCSDCEMYNRGKEESSERIRELEAELERVRRERDATHLQDIEVAKNLVKERDEAQTRAEKAEREREAALRELNALILSGMTLLGSAKRAEALEARAEKAEAALEKARNTARAVAQACHKRAEERNDARSRAGEAIEQLDHAMVLLERARPMVKFHREVSVKDGHGYEIDFADGWFADYEALKKEIK